MPTRTSPTCNTGFARCADARSLSHPLSTVGPQLPPHTTPIRGESTMNVVVLQGTLSRTPDERQLRESVLAPYEVTTRTEEGRAATAPVVWFDPPAAAWKFEAGDE